MLVRRASAATNEARRASSLLCILTAAWLLLATPSAALSAPPPQVTTRAMGRLDPTAWSAVIWDVDGTLVDSFQLGFSATNVVLEKHGHAAITPAEYLEGCRYATPERLARHVGLSPSSATFADVGVALGAEFDATYIAQVDATTAPLFAGLGPVLTRLRDERGLKLGCLTNAAVAYAEAVLNANSLRAQFATVRGADDVPRPKPNPDGLLVCCKDLDLDPATCVYVGDAPTDGAAARAAGFAAVIAVAWDGAANSETKLRDSGHFDVVATSVTDLERLFFAAEFEAPEVDVLPN